MSNKLKRTHMCGEPTKADIGSRITIMGWVQSWRDMGGLIFLDLRDRSGIMQIVLDQAICTKEDFAKAEHIRNEFVLAVEGELVMRDEETINKNLPTGEIEIKVSELQIISKAKTPPFYIEDGIEVREPLRLEYRYLDLRRPEMQAKIMLRHKVVIAFREYLNEKGFIDIETPMLAKSTPEGARDFLVPSRIQPGKFYALPQSPQIFKQLLMVSGFDKYYQVARCFRDEDLRADRQLEFTQIDIEMSFVDEEDVIRINEGLLQHIFKKSMDIELELPLKRLTWQEAMDRYGSDKPDTRFDMELVDLSDTVKDCDFKVFSGAIKKGGSVRAINAKGCGATMPRREVDKLGDFVKDYGAKGLAWIKVNSDGLQSPIVKFMSEEIVNTILEKMGAETGDLIFFMADTNPIVWACLGALRLELAKRLDLIDRSCNDLLWVVDFPQFEYDEKEGRLSALHHPFTSPKDEDIKLLSTTPEKALSKAYDIVWNGNEIGGGSIRIHSSEVQEEMFKALGFTEEDARERFGFLLKALEYGTPPHGGIAYGLDRLVMLMAGAQSIREVIAFPKVQSGTDLMSEAPSEVDLKQLEELHIRTKL